LRNTGSSPKGREFFETALYADTADRNHVAAEFGFDAAIIFPDVAPRALGLPVTFVTGRGQ